MSVSHPIETVDTQPADVAPSGAGPTIDGDTKLTAGRNTGDNRSDTRFRKGISGNPLGRPAGSRNRTTLLREARLAERIDRQLDGMLDALVAKALSGHVGAIRTALALSLSRDRLEPVSDETAGGTDAAPEPVFSAENSSGPAPQPETAETRFPVLSAKIQPAEGGREDAGPVPRTFTVDAPPGTATAALRAFLANLGVAAGPLDRLLCRGTAQLAGLIGIEPELPLAVEPRSYLVAAPANTLPGSLASVLRGLGIELGPDDRILRAGYAPQPMLVMATPPLRIVAPDDPETGVPRLDLAYPRQ